VSLGLPVHLAPLGVSRAVSSSMHAMALVALFIALIGVLTLQSIVPESLVWPAALALVPMFAALWLINHEQTWFSTVAYLLVGAACVYWFVLTGTSEFPGAARTDTFMISMTKVALILVGGVGVGSVPAVGWTIAGFVLAEGATMLAASQTGAQIVFDGTSAVALGLIVLVLTAIGINRHRVRIAKPSLHRAARDEHLSEVRHRMEVRAAAMLHDTVLNDLAALASAADGSLSLEARAQISRDLELLVGEEWLLDAADGPETDAAIIAEWQSTKLATSIDESRRLGLTVEVSGDRSAIGRLSKERSTALALAVKQCLVNVSRHSGTDTAEIVIYGSDDEVSVMVIDSGKGFAAHETGPDRLGLRHSVARRIEDVDGSVQVWSTPGFGTSVLLRVPAPVAGDAASEQAPR